jgi:membrane-associated HD superfamily phosphohydrolase
MNESSTIVIHILLLNTTIFLVSLALLKSSRFIQSDEKKRLLEKQSTSCMRIVAWLFVVIFYLMFFVEDIYWDNINYLYISSVIFTICLILVRKTALAILLFLLLIENVLLIIGFSTRILLIFLASISMLGVFLHLLLLKKYRQASVFIIVVLLVLLFHITIITFL